VAAVGEKIRDEGKSVLVHCEHGRGRTGLTACCILVYLGFEVENAITTV
jgi:protein-tyrosine phosphatase